MGRVLGLLVPFMIATPFLNATSHRDVEYGRAAGGPLLLDAGIPEGSGPFPAVVIVHGGGWIGGDRQLNVQPLFRPLTDAGFAWFSISYRLARHMFEFGDAVDDVGTAIEYVRRSAAKYNVDPDRIAVLGESAGAHLASLAVERSPKSVAAVGAIYPPSDLLSLAESAVLIPESVRQAVRISGMAPLVSAYLRRMSPIEHVTAELPPFLLIHGTEDGIVPFRQSEEMLQKLRGVGVPSELIAVQGGGHGLRGWERSPGLSMYRTKMIAWLNAVLKRSEVKAARL